ncbi:hypothetical protein [Streptomyces echinatus]|uniref:Transposase InsO family protein n=1 Tax=Streptomyces echinatus TaxID=67293 RepID=A0A7W9PR89_9ACTN|nr:hypothetical protein [Streptomyces echinatus]MBB5926366.1 transposase InsO family protein [Streptomyces echinatus]
MTLPPRRSTRWSRSSTSARHRFATTAEARLKIATWIADFYHARRRHSRAGGLPPGKFERIIRQQREAAREKRKAA